jgi:hypothetical protein
MVKHLIDPPLGRDQFVGHVDTNGAVTGSCVCSGVGATNGLALGAVVGVTDASHTHCILGNPTTVEPQLADDEDVNRKSTDMSEIRQPTGRAD